MRGAKVLLLGAICAGSAAPALAQQGIRTPAYEPRGWQSPGPALGLRPQGAGAESGWTGGILLDAPRGAGLSPARTGANDPGLRLRPGFGNVPPQPPQLAPPADPASAVQAGAYLGYRFGEGLLVSSAVRQDLGAPGFGGTKLDFGASYGFHVAPRHLITLSGNLTLGQPSATAPYYYGADARSRADFRLGEPGAGFRLSWLYSFGRNLYLSTTLGYDRMYGDPEWLQAQDRNTTSFGTVFGYRW